jgi:hypothetical protein
LFSELRTEEVTARGVFFAVTLSACCLERVRVQAKAATKTTALAMTADRFEGARIFKGIRIAVTMTVKLI